MSEQETAAVPDLREQMARAFARSIGEDWAWEIRLGMPWDAAAQQRHFQYADEYLVPVVTAHVAVERERAVAEVVEAVLAVHERDLHDSFGRQACICCGLAWPCPTVEALPAQPVDQAQETDR